MASESKKIRLKTSVEIYNRLLWDETLGLDKSRLEIVHHDKYERLKSMVFSAWVPIDQGGDIPFHRIAQFKYNNIILWDRKQRIDNITKNSGHSTLDFQSIKESTYQSSTDENDDNDSNANDEQTQNNDSDSGNVNGNNIITNDINNYQDPLVSSEYIADCQFLSLLKMEPKNVSLLYETLNKMIDNSFITQRPNDIETLARNLCVKYLSYIDSMQKHKYYLFGSAQIGLDTHKSDLDIKIKPAQDTKIATREQFVQLLKRLQYEFGQAKKYKPLHYTLNTTFDPKKINCINITLDDFKNDENHDQIAQLQSRINMENKALDQIIVKVSSVEIADAVIPRCMVSYNIQLISKEEIVMHFKISMDITVSIDITGQEEMSNNHLINWVNKYCINNKDKRVHKFLFAVKLWAQHFKVNISTISTINGYGWIHIALFLLTHYYKQTLHTETNVCIENIENKEQYESMYSDIDIPVDVNYGKLFILFIDMLHSWICYDETKNNNPEKIVRSGMDVITGKWINNSNRYALFVSDPFSQNSNLPGNLTKCVRHRKGIPLLIKAIKSTVQQLQFATDEAIKRNDNAICKYIEFFNQEARIIIINEEGKNDDSISDDETKEDDDDDSSKYYSWKHLCNLNLKLPKRKWIQQNNMKNTDDVITICQFNCLAQDLTSGEKEHNQFKTDKKYLKWGYRSKRILYEILQYKCDIICLCEVDTRHYEDFYYPNLFKSAFKYDGIFLCKNDPNKYQTKTSDSRQRRVPMDGLAIFWNSNKFSCYKKFDCILGKPNKSYHVALGARMKYKSGYRESKEFDVWCTHLKAGRNNKAEYWRLAQVNTLLYYMRKYSRNVPILFCGDLNSHFDALINNEGDLVEAKVYPAILNGEVKSSKPNNNSRKYNKKSEDNYVIKFESLWNNHTRNTFSTWAGWKDRDVKCCLDYIMIGHWDKIVLENKNKKKNKERMFELMQILDIWDEKEIEKFEAKLPNRIYPSDHILIAAKIAIKTE